MNRNLSYGMFLGVNAHGRRTTEYYDCDPNDPLMIAIRALQYDPDARISLMLEPLATVVWSDEMPEDRMLVIPWRPTVGFVYSIFGIRKMLWKSGAVRDEFLRHWTTAQALLPDWPLFRRLEATPKRLQLQRDAEGEMDEVYDYLRRNSSDFERGENAYGLTHLKATLDRDKRKNKPGSEET